MSALAHAQTAALHILPEWQGPVVVIDYRPPCRITRAELSNGPDGPLPHDIVRSLCRTLEVGPGALDFDTDLANPRGIHESASAYVVNAAGVRVARVAGCSAIWLTVAAGVLARDGWKPGRNAEAVPAHVGSSDPARSLTVGQHPARVGSGGPEGPTIAGHQQ